MTPADAEAIRAAVLGWYRANARPLAFRRTADPWSVLVSEFMAQQTQAARAAEAWERFIVAFPTPAALAAASPADALRAWRGLGYNRRAIALRNTALRIVERHGGRVPQTLSELDALPGVGPYTARAVAALAYGARLGAVDTNVRRVLGRALFDTAPSTREIQGIADEIVPADGPGEWTHALMDVGATFCRPRNPHCPACPIEPWCRYAARPDDGSEPAPPPTRPKAAQPPFESSSRWLRGRILDRLRDAPIGAWTRVAGGIGGQDAERVAAALERLAEEGLIERHPGGGNRARLPLA